MSPRSIKKYRLSLHIFRRDLRLEDNTALMEALKLSEKVIPIFIFDERQIKTNTFKGDASIQFMMESLKDLENQLKSKGGKLFFFYGMAEVLIEKLIKELSVDAVFFNRDYTAFSRTRDHQIKKICEKFNVHFIESADILLHEPEEILKDNHQPYVIYTHFLKKSKMIPIGNPQKNNFKNYYIKPIELSLKNPYQKISYVYNEHLLLKGGRSQAKKLLSKIKLIKNYDRDRSFPSNQSTTLLSAHNKFGTISIREFYSKIKECFNEKHTLINELYWRDFFYHIGFHFPHIFGHSFHRYYDQMNWQNNPSFFNDWCNGMTGFPIVDAGMRELNETGFMHNRVRMITASFLTKDLHIDWRKGERYFAQKLLDYDAAVNNGNWQWAASTGCDAQPYFRIFNPWLQQKKFDPDCEYIKKWIPELKNLTPKEIHSLENKTFPHIDYPKPMVNHKEEAEKSKKYYAAIIKK